MTRGSKSSGKVAAKRVSLARVAGPPPLRAYVDTQFAALSDMTIQTSKMGMIGYLDIGHKLNHTAQDFRKAFQLCRYWVENNGFIQLLIPLKIAFFDYGFKIKPKDKSDRKRLDEWLSEETESGVENPEGKRTNKELIDEFRSSLWSEFETLDNAILFWHDEGLVPAQTLPPEKCEFTDVLGVSVLKYLHELTPDQLAMLPEEMKARFKDSEIILGRKKDPQTGKPTMIVESEHYRVLKRSPIGTGFTWPSMLSINHALTQCESMEVGESALGFAMRTVIRQHKIGHKIESGTHGGSPQHFCKPKHVTAVKAQLQGKAGLIDLVGNFDHDILHVWPEAKMFDASKWESPMHRFMGWAGPCGYMLASKGKDINPYLLQMLKTQAIREREKVSPFLATILRKAFSVPVDFDVTWSNRCFTETTLAADLIKFWVQQGAMSNRTGLGESGYDLDEQADEKLTELEMEKANEGILKPIFDAAHGEPEEPAGRPAGTKDPQNKS